MAERDRLPGFERQREFRLGVLEDLSPEHVRREETVAARVPVGRIGWIRGMVEHRNRDWFRFNRTAQHRPLATRAPHRVTLEAFAAGVAARDSFVVEGRRFHRLARGIGQELRFFRRLLERARHAQTERAFLVVTEYDFLNRGERRISFDGPLVGAGAEHEMGPFPDQRLSISLHPFTLDDQLATVDAAFRVDHLAVEDRPHLGRAFSRDRVGVVPEVQSIDVAMVEPQPDVVWMVDAFTRTRLERVAARDEGSLRRANREQRRFLQRRRVDVGREWLPVDRDVHASRGFVGGDGDALRLCGERCGAQ